MRNKCFIDVGPKEETYKMTLEFDNKDAARSFFAHWLDGGGDGGGNIDFETEDWDTKDYSWMRIKGNGDSIE